ncbi:MAG: S8 family serine peptidase [Halolamina sp.]
MTQERDELVSLRMTQHTKRTFLKTAGAALGGVFAGSTVAAAEHADRFVVKTRGTAPPGDVDVVHEMPGVKAAVVRGSESDVKRSRSVKSYGADVTVKLADPEANESTPDVDEAGAADEPGYAIQWDKQAQDVPAAHEATTGEGARIAVIDSGVAGGHPDLAVNERLSRNFTGDGLGAANAAGGYHGTHVAGIAGASDNGRGVIGTAPSAELVDCRVFSPAPGASFGDILAAVVYSAVVDADVANLSLGAYPVPRQALGSFYGGVLNRVMTYANKEGTLLVVAAGNAGADLQHDENFISLPNEGAQGLSVAATGPVGFGWDATAVGDEEESPSSPAIYTNYGTNAIDLATPGGDYSPAGIGEDVPWYLDLVFNTLSIPSYETRDGEVTGIADTSHTYGWLAGTSMAAPQVAGAAALVASVDPSLNANRIESVLERTASVPDGYDKAYYGAGFLDPVAAVEDVR